MKKILSVAVVMAMAAALSVSAFASTTVADNGSDIKFDVPKANTTPVMDGVINPGEYSEIATAEADWCIGTPNDDWDEAAWNLAKTAKVYMSWDENYIYYASTFTAPFGFYCPWEDEPGSIWYSGCMQMAYSSLEDHEDATSNHWEDGVGKAENGNKVYISYGTPEGYDQTDEETLAGLFDFTINGNDVVFEHRVPYQAFAPGAFAEGQQYGMCAVYSIGQDQDYLHVQLSGGVSGGKDQSMNAVITLKPAPVVETEAPETEAPAPETEAPAPETEAPAPVAETAAPVAETAAPVAEAAPAAAAPAAQTGDVAAVVVLAAVAAVGTAVVVSKKH